jgi:hypothetical protein
VKEIERFRPECGWTFARRISSNLKLSARSFRLRSAPVFAFSPIGGKVQCCRPVWRGYIISSAIRYFCRVQQLSSSMDSLNTTTQMNVSVIYLSQPTGEVAAESLRAFAKR